MTRKHHAKGLVYKGSINWTILYYMNSFVWVTAEELLDDLSYKYRVLPELVTFRILMCKLRRSGYLVRSFARSRPNNYRIAKYRLRDGLVLKDLEYVDNERN